MGWPMKRLRPGVAALAVTAIAGMALAVAAPAGAADMPVPAPAYTPPPAYVPPALYNWTGFYLGGNVGADLLSDSVTQAGAGAFVVPSSTSVGPAGFLGGGQLGFNYQLGPAVAGVEAALDGTTLSGNGSAPLVGGAVGSATMRSTSAPRWIGAVTGRIGYAANDLLFYVKGGGAWMDVTYTQDVLTATGATLNTQHIEDTRSGFTAGVGIEYGLIENVSARLEYDFYSFGTKTYNFNAALNQTPVSIRSNLNTFLFGLNYRFGWPGGGPVAAKY